MRDTDFDDLPTAPLGFVWVNGSHCVRVADIQAVRSEYISVMVFVRGWEKPIEINAPGGSGSKVTADLLDRMQAADPTTEQ